MARFFCILSALSLELYFFRPEFPFKVSFSDCCLLLIDAIEKMNDLH